MDGIAAGQLVIAHEPSIGIALETLLAGSRPPTALVVPSLEECSLLAKGGTSERALRIFEARGLPNLAETVGRWMRRTLERMRALRLDREDGAVLNTHLAFHPSLVDERPRVRVEDRRSRHRSARCAEALALRQSGAAWAGSAWRCSLITQRAAGRARSRSSTYVA